MTEEINVEAVTPEIEEAEKKEKPQKGYAEVAYYVPFSALTFEDIDEFVKAEETAERVGEVTRQFETLTYNIMNNSEVTDKSSAMQTIVGQLDSRLSQAVEMGSKSVWDKVRGLFRKEKPAPERKEGLLIWKEKDRYRWFAVYSNKFRDEDFPPEIISEKAHKTYVELVDKGLVPFPELWHWHIPGSRWGEADWVAYDSDLGFSLASGLVDVGHEKEAEAIMEYDEPLAVSHGLYVLERNEDDETIIDGYFSEEISDLPIKAAANKLTGFSLIESKENEMIPEDKKVHLRSVGLSEDQIKGIESDLEGKAVKAEETGLEFKEAPVESPEGSAVAEQAPEAVPTEVDDLTLPVTRQEVAEAITQVVTPLVANIGTLTEAIAGLKEKDTAKIKEVAADTPAFSIAHLVSHSLSAIGKKETEVDGEVVGPKEKASGEKSISGVSWIDSMLVKEK